MKIFDKIINKHREKLYKKQLQSFYECHKDYLMGEILKPMFGHNQKNNPELAFQCLDMLRKQEYIDKNQPKQSKI